MAERSAAPVIGYIVHGRGGKHPSSAHVRVLSRVEHARSLGTAQWQQVDPEAYAENRDPTVYAAIVIQRDSVSESFVERLCQRASEEATRIVVELDDDLVTDEARGRLASQGYAFTRLNAVRYVLERADHVVVSTEFLASLVQPFAHSVGVVPNMLDSSHWNLRSRGRGAVSQRRGPARVLYMGTRTHTDDLRLLEPVFRPRVGQAPRQDIVLEVVGVTRAASADWYTRLEVPREHGNYPEFVAWLDRQRSRWDAGVAPLADTSFNRSKSDLKFLEYTGLGLPTVASRRLPYDGIDQHGAILVDDEPLEWNDALLRAVTPSAGRSQALDTARDFVKSTRMIKAKGPAVREWEDSILGR